MSVVKKSDAVSSRANAALKKHWGYNKLKPEQEQAIVSVCCHKDVLAILPTGFGKSAIFQISALLAEGCAIVFSPLIALMKDQVDDCKLRGIPASYLNSHVDADETALRLRKMIKGRYSLMYVSPERMRSKQFMQALVKTDVSMFVVDEAHCHVAGTMIATPGGCVPVESLMCGDTVLSFDHSSGNVVERPVISTGSRQVDSKSTCSTSGMVVTKDHPIYTPHGYVPAVSVRPEERMLVLDGKDLHNLRKTISLPRQAREDSEVLQQQVLWHCASPEGAEDAGKTVQAVREADAAGRRQKDEDSIAQRALLFTQVLVDVPAIATDREAMQLVQFIVSGCENAAEAEILLSGVFLVLGSRLCVGSYAPEQSNALARRAAESFRKAQAGACAESASGWERTWAHQTATDGLVVVPGTEAGVYYIHRRSWHRETLPVSRGPSLPQAARDYRVRWTVASRLASKDVGPSAGHCLGESGMADTADQQQRRYTEDSQGRTCVYSIGVEGEHNYFANGVLVHNCVSRYGSDFRPAYQRIIDVVTRFRKMGVNVPVLSVTATATPDIVGDIVRGTGMRENFVKIMADPVRPNLNYKVLFTNNSWNSLDGKVAEIDPQAGRHIIYVATRKAAEIVADKVKETHPDAGVGFYHGAMEKEEREEVQNAFKAGTHRVIAATCAFGMGIDVPDIRSVIHFGIPGSLEDYMQETGRAGRDGLPSNITLIDDEYSTALRTRFVNWANPPWDYYALMWPWLLAACEAEEDGIIKLTVEGIAEELRRLAPDFSIENAMVGAALNLLESSGLIKRAYCPSGVQIKANPSVLGAYAKSSSSLIVKHVWEKLISPKARFAMKPGQKVSAVVDLTSIALEVGANKSSVRYALSKLDEQGILKMENQFHGKTTQIIDPGVDLTERITPEFVVAKRDREMKKLNAMIMYTRVPDRMDFVRRYFEGDVEVDVG